MTDDATPPERPVGETSPGPFRLRYAAFSDVGRVRKDNQDSGFASEHLLMIADGVGGAARGDIASSTAVQIMRRLDGPAPDNSHEALAGAIHRTHDRLAELVEQDPELDGTSTTVTAALFDGAKVTVGHVGDSRGYLLREGALSQLTKDHTFVQSLIDEGRITEEESRTHPHRNLILRAVDGVHETEPDLFDVDLAVGDRILLCSDGCSGSLDAARLADILGTGSVDYATVELIRASLEAGSTDNVTAVVADVVPADAPEDEESSAAAFGAILVGAAAEQPRKAGAATATGARNFFRGHRGGDTGELEPVAGADGETGARDERPLDPEALRYAPRAPRRFLWFRRIAVLLVLLALLVAGSMYAYDWSQKQFYVAVDTGRVTIYRGIQAELPGIELQSVAESTDVTVESLPTYQAEQVTAGIPADDLDHAHEIVDELTGMAEVCPEPEPEPTPSADPTTDKRDGKKRDEPSPSPSPEPTPSPTIAPPACIEAATASPDASPTASPEASPGAEPTP
ncbi:MAG: protein phosphatase 2C domain-containing protein [Nocardioides sp.]